MLAVRFAAGYNQSLLSAAYLGVYTHTSSFNNAGFAPNADNLMHYVADPWISLTIYAAAILGGWASRWSSRRSASGRHRVLGRCRPASPSWSPPPSSPTAPSGC